MILWYNEEIEKESNMKYLAPVIIVALVVLLPAVGGTVGMGFVDLPEPVETGITAVVVWAISWVFVQLITLVPFLKFLDQFKMPLAMAISAQLISLIENLVPDAFGGVAISGIVFVLAVLALFGVGGKLAENNAPGFRARK